MIFDVISSLGEGLMKLILISLLITTGLIVLSSEVFAQSSYRIVAIPKPPGDFFQCEIYGLSDEGSVLGNCDTSNSNISTPFLWKNGAFTYLKDALGSLPNSTYMTARDINSAGIVSFSTGSHVGVIENGVARILGSIPDRLYGADTRINELGDVIYSDDSSGSNTTEVYVFRNGSQTYFTPEVPVGRLGLLQGFNNRGDAVFRGTNGGNVKYALRSYVLDTNTGAVRELPRKGKGIFVSDINDSGTIVGTFNDAKYAVLPFKISNIRVVNLPQVVAYNSTFSDKTKYFVGGINNKGSISGSAYDRIVKGSKIKYLWKGAFVWSSSGIANFTAQLRPLVGKLSVFSGGDVSECGAAAFKIGGFTGAKPPTTIGAVAIPSGCSF